MRRGDADRAYAVMCTALDEYFDRSVVDYFILQWPDGQIVASEPVGNIIGYLAGARLQNGRASISLFCVSPEHRGRGVGSSMLDRFMSSARIAGFRAAQLEVRQDNARVVEFYRRRGFMVAEVLPGFYNDGGTAVRMIGSTAPRSFIS